MTSPGDFSADFRRGRLGVEPDAGERPLRSLPGRRVYRAKRDGVRVVVKEYAARGLRDRLRPRAELEAERALEAARRGVPVVEPLGTARLPGGRSMILLREIEGARTLQDLVLSSLSEDTTALVGEGRHDLCRRVAELIATLHNAGVRHNDLHAGNILVRPDASVLFSDAAALRPGSYLTSKERAHSLTDFALFFLTHGKRSDLLLFWGAYGRASGVTPETLEEIRVLVSTRMPRAFRRLARKRATSLVRHGWEFRHGPFYGNTLGEDAISRDAVHEICRRSERLRDAPGVLKKSPTCWTFRAGERGEAAEEGPYVVKVFLPKYVSRPFRDAVRGTRAERALRAAEALRHRGVATPEVVAVARDGRVPNRSILVMRAADHARPAKEVLHDAGAASLRGPVWRVARALRRLHDWGLRHRDLKADNVWVTHAGELLLLDMDGVRQSRRPVPWDQRAGDLGRLAATFDPRLAPLGFQLRFLDAYLGDAPPEDWAPGLFLRRVAAAAAEVRRAHALRYG